MTTATDYKSGDLVQFDPAFSDGDEDLYIIREWHSDSGRGFISPAVWTHGPIIPTELVTAEMIPPA